MQIGLNAGVDSFADRVRNRRIALGLTQGDVAKTSGLKQSDISKIENARINETPKILGLARALKCDPDWLSTGKGDMQAQTAVKPLLVSEPTPDQLMQYIKQALDVIETALVKLDMSGRERVAPLFESFARSPGAVIKADISAFLDEHDAYKSNAAENAALQKTG